MPASTPNDPASSHSPERATSPSDTVNPSDLNEAPRGLSEDWTSGIVGVGIIVCSLLICLATSRPS